MLLFQGWEDGLFFVPTAIKESFPHAFDSSERWTTFCALGQLFLSLQCQHWEAVIDMTGVCMVNRGQILSRLLPMSACFSPFIQVWAKENLGGDVCCVHDHSYLRITGAREILTTGFYHLWQLAPWQGNNHVPLPWRSIEEDYLPNISSQRRGLGKLWVQLMSHLLQYLSLMSWQECERGHADCAAYL